MSRASLVTKVLGFAFGSLVACGPTETGNPPQLDTFSTTVGSSDPSAIAISPDEGAVTVDAIWQGVAEIGFIDCSGNTLYLRAPGEATATELVSGFQPISAGRVRPGTYCVLRLGETTIPTSDRIPPQLATHTFFATGTRSDGARFEFMASGASFDAEFPMPLTLGADADPLLGELDVARLLLPLGVDQVAVDADGVARLIIDTETFRTAYIASTELYSDRNRNGRVDAGDQSLF
jgi:hypothetical protein